MLDTHRTFWLKRARREAIRFNFGWWLQFFLPWVFGVGILGSVCILALRSANQGFFGLAVVAVFLTLGGIACALMFAGRRFLSLPEALARLDADVGLHSRLSSASEGVGEWPSPQPRAGLALRWDWAALLRPPLVACALVIASALIPLPKGQSRPAAPTTNPPSWDSIQIRLDALKESELVQAEALEGLQKSLDALRNQPADQWYDHESLEASDQLQEQLDQSAGKLGAQLEIALSVMEAARETEAHQLHALAGSLDNALGQTIQAMELGALPLNEQTLSQLKGLDSSRLRQLSSEEWKSLCDRLKEGIAASSTGYSAGDEAREARLASIPGQGAGGVDRGPGEAPLMLKAEKTQLGTTQTEPVQNEDLSRAAAGDLAGLSAGEPRADKTTWTPGQSGGANSSTGTGGEAVWDQVATPAEQEALRRFFK
jgi:hypothetical protein